MKSKATKSLKSLLLLSVIFIFIALIGLFTNVLVQRPISWINLIPIILLPILLFILSMVSLDLVKQDYVTIKGKLVEKKVYTVGILTERSKIRKFRVNQEFVKEINELKLDQEIEIQYYRRTKAVTQIKKLIEPS